MGEFCGRFGTGDLIGVFDASKRVSLVFVGEAFLTGEASPEFLAEVFALVNGMIWDVMLVVRKGKLLETKRNERNEKNGR